MKKMFTETFVLTKSMKKTGKKLGNKVGFDRPILTSSRKARSVTSYSSPIGHD